MNETKPLDLEVIEARCDAASPGPWTWKDWGAPLSEHWTLQAPPQARDGGPSKMYPDLGCPILQIEERDSRRLRDHEFIAHAREDVPALVAEVKRLREALAPFAREWDALVHIGEQDSHHTTPASVRLPARQGTAPMNDDFDNAITDKEALEKFAPEAGEVFDSDAPAGSGWDKERHCATDLRGADWAARKLREALEQCALNARMHEAEMEALNRKMMEAEERLVRANAPFRKAAAFMENALHVFAETHREEVLRGLRTKSRLLPSGVRIGWKKAGGEYRWRKDMTPAEREAALLAWAQDYDARLGTEFVEKRPALKPLAVVTKHLNAHWPRQVVPGLEYVPESEELRIETGIDAGKEET